MLSPALQNQQTKIAAHAHEQQLQHARHMHAGWPSTTRANSNTSAAACDGSERSKLGVALVHAARHEDVPAAWRLQQLQQNTTSAYTRKAKPLAGQRQQALPLRRVQHGHVATKKKTSVSTGLLKFFEKPPNPIPIVGLPWSLQTRQHCLTASSLGRHLLGRTCAAEFLLLACVVRWGGTCWRWHHQCHCCTPGRHEIHA